MICLTRRKRSDESKRKSAHSPGGHKGVSSKVLGTPQDVDSLERQLLSSKGPGRWPASIPSGQSTRNITPIRDLLPVILDPDGYDVFGRSADEDAAEGSRGCCSCPTVSHPPNGDCSAESRFQHAIFPSAIIRIHDVTTGTTNSELQLGNALDLLQEILDLERL